MKLIFSISFIFLLLLKLVNCEIINIETQKKAAEKVLKNNTKIYPKSAEIQNEIVVFSESKPSLYIFNLKNNKGFLIYSAESSTRDLIAYSFSGTYNPDNVPEELKILLEQYIKEIDFIRNSDNKYISKKAYLKTKNITGINPLISTLWDQSCFYNDSCPVAINSGAYYCQHVPAGCVAVAISQIIRFHQYPISGIGSKTYYSPYYGMLSVDFSSSTYNYSVMPDILYSENPSVAKLIYHCGVAVNTDFRPYYSGANISDARNALVNYFNYSNSAQIVQKQNYNDLSWKSLIKSELDSARPVFYSGNGPNNNNGHAFICDGYTSNDFFHINWGWGGLYNGYFQLSLLNPGSNNFSYNQSAIIGIKPLNNYPVSHFTSDKSIVSCGESVNFTDLSSGYPNSWSWNFAGGNPANSNQQHPVNILYENPGTYPVSLTVVNNMGTSSLCKTSYITVAPFADFNSDKNVIATGENINFTNQSITISPPTNVQWLFTGGNPNSSSLLNPTNISYFQPGTYDVTLTINTPEGNHSVTKSNYITVYSSCNKLFKDSIPKYFINTFDADSFQIFQEDFDSLTPYYTGHSTKWNIYNKVIAPGDTNFFYGATSFFTQGGQADNWLEIGPISVPLKGAVFKWEHLYYLNTKRDGYEVLLSTTGLKRESYTAPPVFSRFDNDPLTEYDTVWTHQQVEINGGIYGGKKIYIAFHHFANNKYYLFLDNLQMVNCSVLPVNAEFTSDSTHIQTGNLVNFTDQSSGNPILWKWNFYGGNPSYSDIKNPQGITYSTSGSYDVKLLVFNGEQTDSIIKQNYIVVGNTGISINTYKEDYQVFPNPVKDFLFIRKLNSNSEMNITIYNTLGIIIKNIVTTESFKKINLNDLNEGFYIVEVKSLKETFYKKILKQ